MITIKLKGFDKTIKDVQKLATDTNKNAKTASFKLLAFS